MQNVSLVLICDNDSSRAQALSTVLDFIGIACTQVTAIDLEARLQSKPMGCVVFLGGDLSQSQQWCQDYLKTPFVFIDEQFSSEAKHNQLGHISQPFQYEALTVLLHHCDAYLGQLPTKPNAKNNPLLKQNLVGKGIAIQQVRELIEQVSHTQASVLILGESGTGKEVVAKSIHDHSTRNQGPFVPINCGAIPAELLESELFGHEKGAFTGAFAMRKGRFELAEGGTLFLDEIGDMPRDMQVKLLRVLQERKFERVGGSKSINADVRIIAATHQNLETLTGKGEFREDLFYRLNVFPIDMPALRERQDDVPLLLQEMVSRHEQEHQAGLKFTQSALASLMQHQWPGNVRELSNLVERLLILHPNQIIDIADLPTPYQHGDCQAFQPEYPEDIDDHSVLMNVLQEDAQNDLNDTSSLSVAAGLEELPEQGVNLKDMLAELEVGLIRQSLEQHQWVVARAAETLGMGRTTLVEKMKKYGVSKC